ncbi:hypothetical protein BpHYR1_027299 [Brachionus plicatilis]|uniref:Uncharacterized protein n=1 Tax=Brachionus plicatilis TaxID=10195 RepID=A0A3M7Q2Q1_BRAPC|nr:hypothetical protein BpHYR1_027299 [Brachionus plicatilis]
MAIKEIEDEKNKLAKNGKQTNIRIKESKS